MDIGDDAAYRTGYGWDRHRLAAGRKLVLGGITVPAPYGEEGHSDGDVLTHALIDAILGAAALGDIGTHFPPTEPCWKDISSLELLDRVMEMLADKQYTVINADTVVTLESPKIGPFRKLMEEQLAEHLGIRKDMVSVKAKTAEGLGPTGRGEAVDAAASVLIQKLDRSIYV